MDKLNSKNTSSEPAECRLDIYVKVEKGGICKNVMEVRLQSCLNVNVVNRVHKIISYYQAVPLIGVK